MNAPGQVNAHTHLYSGLVPLGMPPLHPPAQGFLDLLDRLWWRMDRALDLSLLRAAARYHAAHALLAGTTAVIDHHESPWCIEGSLDVLADACEELGLRALLCYGASERNGGRDEAEQGLAECARFLRSNERPLVRGLVGLHASFTVSDQTLRDAGRLGWELDTVVHVHVAEDHADVDDVWARGFAGPLERLLALEALPRGSILAHGVHLSPEQVKLADETGLWLVQNPRSNENNGVGYPAALRESRHVALGTDGFPSDMGEELAALRRLARAHGDESAMAERRLAAGRTLLAARFGEAIDDHVERDAEGRVRQVVVGGRQVVEDGALTGADLGQIEAEARSAAGQLWTRMRSLGDG
jgi:cytosine/adenosine deaminase-related metal-dependent hydrolase